jgi:hypothetical protein
VTKHRWIRYHVTLQEAMLYAAELARREKISEFQRQQLFEVINGSLGGDFKADRRLLEGLFKEAAPPPGGRQQVRQWVRLAEVLGADVPEPVRRLADGGDH